MALAFSIKGAVALVGVIAESWDACKAGRLHLKAQQNGSSEWIVSALGIYVTWGLLRSTH